MVDDNKIPEVKPSDVLDSVLKMSDDDIMPWEDVTLPSLGLYYDSKVPGGVVKVKAMGLAADKVLATQRLAQNGKSIDYLFKKCVKLPDGFDAKNLLVGDRVFLLYYLRGITHGNMYEYVAKCTNEECGKENIKSYDLNNLVPTIKRADSENIGTEPFKVVLPHMSKVAKADFWVKVRFMRGYDLESMFNNRNVNKRLKGIETLDETIEDHLNMLIVNAMGSEDRNKIRTLIGKLHSTDTAVIREFLRVNSPGIDTSVEIECEFCSNLMKMELPITESFFRPTFARVNRE